MCEGTGVVETAIVGAGLLPARLIVRLGNAIRLSVWVLKRDGFHGMSVARHG
jgi:hypothetical protein